MKQSIFRVWLIPRLGKRRLDEISNRDVQELKAAMVHRGRKHTNNVLTTLGTLLRTAVGLKIIDALPCDIKLLKVPRKSKPFWDFDDFERLVDDAKAIDPRVRVVVLLGGEAGLRIGEIVALEQSDVDYRRGFVSIRRREYRGAIDTPKGSNERRFQ